jgi:hypothetical protein
MDIHQRLTERIVDKFEAEAEAWNLSTDSGDRLAGIAARAAVAAMPELLTNDDVMVRAAKNLTDEGVQNRAVQVAERIPVGYGIAAGACALAKALAEDLS